MRLILTLSIFVALLVFPILFAGCADNPEYSLRRHLHYCLDYAHNQGKKGRLLLKVINKCMNIKGHPDFNYETYEGRKSVFGKKEINITDDKK